MCIASAYPAASRRVTIQTHRFHPRLAVPTLLAPVCSTAPQHNHTRKSAVRTVEQRGGQKTIKIEGDVGKPKLSLVVLCIELATTATAKGTFVDPGRMTKKTHALRSTYSDAVSRCRIALCIRFEIQSPCGIDKPGNQGHVEGHETSKS